MAKPLTALTLGELDDVLSVASWTPAMLIHKIEQSDRALLDWVRPYFRELARNGRHADNPVEIPDGPIVAWIDRERATHRAADIRDHLCPACGNFAVQTVNGRAVCQECEWREVEVESPAPTTAASALTPWTVLMTCGSDQFAYHVRALDHADANARALGMLTATDRAREHAHMAIPGHVPVFGALNTCSVCGLAAGGNGGREDGDHVACHLRKLDDSAIGDMAEEALNAALALIQNKLGATGDYAAHHFASGNPITRGLREYIREEIAHLTGDE